MGKNPSIGGSKMDYSFHYNNAMARTGVYMALKNLLGTLSASPVVLCIGSDLAVGDSLGPIVGTMLQTGRPFQGYIYGTLKNPITAKEAKYLVDFLKKTHPHRDIIAVDAAVGEEQDVGLVKVTAGAIRPGAGANKRLPKVGDVSILGIVAKKAPLSYPLFNLTRLGAVYSMADIIAGAISDLTSDQLVNKSQNCV